MRSTAQPTTGANTYMPMMCTLMTNPTTCSSWAPDRMCSGVAVITPVITACPTTMPPAARRAAGLAAIARTGPAASPIRSFRATSAPVRGAAGRNAPSTSSGSGRSQRCTSPAAPTNTTADSRLGPASAGSPAASAA